MLHVMGKVIFLAFAAGWDFTSAHNAISRSLRNAWKKMQSFLNFKSFHIVFWTQTWGLVSVSNFAQVYEFFHPKKREKNSGGMSSLSPPCSILPNEKTPMNNVFPPSSLNVKIALFSPQMCSIMRYRAVKLHGRMKLAMQNAPDCALSVIRISCPSASPRQNQPCISYDSDFKQDI